MASITKRAKGYYIKVSCGYDINGRQIIHSKTWTPEPNMAQRPMGRWRLVLYLMEQQTNESPYTNPLVFEFFRKPSHIP